MTDRPLTAVVIGYVWPEPNSSAAGQNMLNLLLQLKNAGYSVTYMSAATLSPHAIALGDYGVAQQSIALNCSSFDRALAALAPDVVVFDRYMTEEQFSARVHSTCPNAVRVLNTEDLHCLRKSRHEAVKRNVRYQDAPLNSELCHRELASILRSDMTLVVSRYELALLSETCHVPAAQLCYQPLPIDTTNAPHTAPYESREHFVFVGNFRHAPNWDAVLLLKQKIWPQIAHALPQAEMHIYGAYPPKKATDLHCPRSRFFVDGWCENADEVIASSKVLLAPLRFGAGIKGKLLSAMRNATPSVTTSIGAEGITGDRDWPGRVEDEWEHFCRAAIELYRDKSLWQHASDKAADALSQYSRTDSEAAFTRRLTEITNDIDAHRSALYLQGMLWHHTLTSTHYMTQWIEAKNNA